MALRPRDWYRFIIARTKNCEFRENAVLFFEREVQKECVGQV